MGEKLGQHFLDNPLIAVRIIDILSPGAGENILEIGPGQGFLTSYLLDSADRVTAVEIDKNLVSSLKKNYDSEKLQVIEGDFLQADLSILKPDKICGNLPYQICGKIIEKILVSPVPWTLAVLMLPLAVASRAAALPGSSEYSRLSVLCSGSGEVKIEFKVEKENFDPPPKIESAVISIYKKNILSKNFLSLVGGAFRERRKKLKNSLSSHFSMSASEIKKILDKYGIDENSRAQELNVMKFEVLTKEFVKRKIL